MPKIALILLVIIVFLIVVFVVLLSMRGGAKTEDPNVIQVTLEKGTAMNIVHDDDSTVRVEYTSFEDRPRSVEVFPDMVSDLEEVERDLDRAFWDAYAHKEDFPYEKRVEIAEKLIRHGYLTREQFETVTLPALKDPETGEPIVLPPDPSDEDSMMAHFTRPFV